MPEISNEALSTAAEDERVGADAGVTAGAAADGEVKLGGERGSGAGDRAAWLFPLAALTVCLFGAGREVWSLALAAILMGLVMVCAPPARRLPLIAAAALALALVAPLAALLPADWFSLEVPWRRQLTQEWGILLGGAVSPQPAVTIEAWLVMAGLIVWLWACLGQGFTERHRRVIIRLLALGGSLLALLAMLAHWNVIEIPWWPRSVAWGMGFGPFSNRNHISSIGAITCVLSAAAAYDAHRRQSWLWMVFASSFLTAGACIFVNTSRGGLLLFFVGMTAWLGTASLKRGFFKNLAVSASVLFVGASAVMVLGGNLSKRLVSSGGLAATTKDARIVLYRETLAMTAESPWLGIGLGNFTSVFPMARDFHEPRNRFLHPESDVIWILSEGGLLTLLPLAAFVGWWCGTTGPWFGREAKGSKGRLDRRLRKAAAIAGMLALLHGLFDVPNHGVGYAMVISVLFAAAVAPQRLDSPAAGWHRWGFRGLALIPIVLGAGWLAVARGALNVPLASTSSVLHDHAIAASATGEYSAARGMVDRAIRLTPLDFRLYYLRAQLKLYIGRPPEEAMVDFGRARTIEPHYARFCYDEGVFWLAYDPQMAVIPWREYLHRYPESGPGIHGIYRQMLRHATPYPELRRELWKLAVSPSLKLDYLESAAPGDEWDQALNALLAQQPELSALDFEERRRLFAAWQARGDRDHLLAEFERRPRWREDGWRVLADEYARRGEFQLAYLTAAQFVPMPSRDPGLARADLGQLERAFVYSPADPRRGLELYYAQRAKGQVDEALVTLEKVARLPDAPVFVRQEMASLYAMKQDYQRAWELLQTAIPRP